MTRMKQILCVGTAAFALAACGNRTELKPQAGKSLPVVPLGAEAPKKPSELLEPSTQARPERSVELLRRSEEREDDEFDLPPE
ncbi:hypothetical protein [Sphingorhabdus sp. Alg239-R122]|uniref:hypothetical protein n=1 Tax=Sphingorhabdus sp. Alg239-R122 TaxID=2305989 RepID=UPI00196851FC|nr:hypothetical protein [Sphingorhabdus sp. Alg239-R122]